MQNQNMRVLIATEYPKARRLLREAVEEEAGTIIVGEAENAATVLTLARTLRPDIAIIDSCLPRAVGSEVVPLSRIGGLDVAQALCGEMPGIRVVLVTKCTHDYCRQASRGAMLGRCLCLYNQAVSGDDWNSSVVAGFCRERSGANIPLKLQELCIEAEIPSIPVFTTIRLRPRETPEQKGLSMGDKFLLIGGLGIASGWFLIITIMLAPVGFFLGLFGATTMSIGLMGKLATRWRRKGTQI